MSKIKSVSQFEDNIWGEATPIGADASNIDVEMSDSSTKDLQTVLGDIPSAAAPIQSQINTKVTASGGNIGNTTVSSGIQNFDSSSSETSTELLDTSVRVTNATEVTSSMWTKFNRFRKRVDNKFKDVFLSSVEDVASPSLTKTYSQSALNDYFANVVGYASASDLPDATSTIAQHLSTLNNNAIIESSTRADTSYLGGWHYRIFANSWVECWRNYALTLNANALNINSYLEYPVLFQWVPIRNVGLAAGGSQNYKAFCVADHTAAYPNNQYIRLGFYNGTTTNNVIVQANIYICGWQKQ